MTSPPQQLELACSWQVSGGVTSHIQPKNILGRVHYGTAQKTPDADMAIALQPASTAPTHWQECWYSQQAVTQTCYRGILVRYNQDVLWGCLSMPVVFQYGCRHIIYKHYVRLFEVLARLHFPYLWRVWNFIPHINEPTTAGIETYREFNQGRAQAYARAYQHHLLPQNALQTMPAATAIGCLGETAHVYFIAARLAGRVIDNPLQTAPIHYPNQYGAYAPRFARARLTATNSQTKPMLCISGTAGITGYRSMCYEDVIGQCRVMWRNINTLLEQVQSSPQQLYGIKVYVRYMQHVAVVKNYLHSVLPANTPVAYFVADICRTDLLVEMEALA